MTNERPYVVLCHADAAVRERLTEQLRRHGRVDVAAGLDDVVGLLAVAAADCLVVELPKTGAARAVLGRVSAAYPRTRIIVLAGPLSFDDARDVVRLGAHDIVPSAAEPDAVAVAVREALSENGLGEPGGRGTAVLVVSGKGGTGCTAVALHLAAALARHGTAAVADADAPPFGAVAASVDLDSEASIAALVRQRLPIAAPVLRRAGLPHSGGFTAFAFWTAPDDPEESTAAIAPVMDALSAGLPFVVVDVGRPVLAAQRLLVRRAALAVAVATLDLLALRGLRRVSDLLAAEGVAKVVPLLNRCGGAASYTVEQAEEALGAPFSAVLPETPRLARCMDQGVLLSTAAPDDPWWQAVERFAGEIVARRRQDFRTALGTAL